MSEPLDSLRTAYAAWNRGDWDAVAEFFADDIEWIEFERLPDASVLHGVAAAIGSSTRFREAWNDVRILIEDAEEVGDHVILAVRYLASGRHGMNLDAPMIHLWTLRHGLGARLHMLARREDALAEIDALQGTESLA